MRDVEYCMPPHHQHVSKHVLFHYDLELWPFDPQMWTVRSCPLHTVAVSLVKLLSNIFQISYYRTAKVLFPAHFIMPCLRSLNFWLHCTTMHHCCKFGWNPSNIFQDIALTMFATHARKHPRTKSTHNGSGHTMWNRGIKIAMDCIFTSHHTLICSSTLLRYPTAP